METIKEQKVTTILAVEDNLDDLALMDEEFKKAPGDFHIQLRVVYDGVQAKDYLEGLGNYADRQRYPIPDIIILDLKMPRWSGFEFLEWLQSHPIEGRVLQKIAVSGSVRQSDVDQCLALGANGYLTKPLRWDQFFECVRKFNPV